MLSDKLACGGPDLCENLIGVKSFANFGKSSGFVQNFGRLAVGSAFVLSFI